MWCVHINIYKYKDCGGTYCHLSRYTLKMEVVNFFETVVPMLTMPEDCIHSREKLTSHVAYFMALTQSCVNFDENFKSMAVLHSTYGYFLT